MKTNSEILLNALLTDLYALLSLRHTSFLCYRMYAVLDASYISQQMQKFEEIARVEDHFQTMCPYDWFCPVI